MGHSSDAVDVYAETLHEQRQEISNILTNSKCPEKENEKMKQGGEVEVCIHDELACEL